MSDEQRDQLLGGRGCDMGDVAAGDLVEAGVGHPLAPEPDIGEAAVVVAHEEVDRLGQGLVEYGLILSLTALLTTVWLVVFGGTVSDALTTIAIAIDRATGG